MVEKLDSLAFQALGRLNPQVWPDILKLHDDKPAIFANDTTDTHVRWFLRPTRRFIRSRTVVDIETQSLC